jgi:GMP synthase-like glutamine amidotransferase
VGTTLLDSLLPDNTHDEGIHMRALFLQHDHVSPPGPVAERFAERGYDIEEQIVVPREQFLSPNVTFDFPDPEEFDVLVPMGSPWGAWDDDRIGAWLLPELTWLASAHAKRVPILGICFGGQALARALGGTVAPGPRPEIGWTVLRTEQPDIVSSGPWFQFHYDRFTVPPGSTEIARTPIASQAYVIGRSLGVQFHPEMLGSTLEAWLNEGGTREVANDGQDVDVLLEMTYAEDASATARAHALVDAFLDRVATSD